MYATHPRLADDILDYVDSGDNEISVFDYDNSTGTPSNRRKFAGPPPAMDDQPTEGVFDGLTVDGQGNIWVARFKDRRIVGYAPDGKIICNILVPKCKNPTIPGFGGQSSTRCSPVN